MEVKLKPIGFVRTSFSDEEIKTKHPDDIEAEIEIFEEYAEGLDGIEGFSHLIILFYMHKVTEEQRRILKARPRRFTRYGLTLEELPLVGVFCLDSPHRPNPIGLTIVKFLDKNGHTLKVKGLDAFNGTPILDIKPYTPSRCKRKFKLPDWYTLTLEKIRKKGVKLKDL